MTADAARAELTIFQPNLAPVRHKLTPEITTLGRSADCTIPIKDRFLSRRHAEISFQRGSWILRDCGSANGTMLNGVRVEQDIELRPGDRIALGDTEIVFQLDSGHLSVEDSHPASSIAIPMKTLFADDTASRNLEHSKIINALAIELIEDHPLSELFDVIVDRVMRLLRPSRVALALLAEDHKSFVTTKLRKSDNDDATDLTISRTLLKEVIDEKKVLSFVNVSEDERLRQALSIVGQSIRSALCAPLMVGEDVLGVLYVDYLLTERNISEEDVRLVAQVARIAAIKLETTRLREEAMAKQRLEQELRTAAEIQARLLPSEPPSIEGYTVYGVNKPARMVSGDYFDYVLQADGRLYFIIADVSGKGITAALIMSSLATAFSIFTRNYLSPSELLREINLTLTPKTSPYKFATVLVGILDRHSGVLNFANAGHVPPVVVTADGASELKMTDMVVGLFAAASYRDQTVTLAPGDSIVLFTDGIIEAENQTGDQLGGAPVLECLAKLHCCNASGLIEAVEHQVREFASGVPPGDDVTLLAIAREG